MYWCFTNQLNVNPILRPAGTPDCQFEPRLNTSSAVNQANPPAPLAQHPLADSR